jgi:hypothetical protein
MVTFPLDWSFWMQLTAQQARFAQIVRCMNASLRAGIPQREHFGKVAPDAKRVA